MRCARIISLAVVSSLICLLLAAGCQSAVERLPTPTGVFPAPGAVLTPQPNATPQPALLERRLLILEWPKTIREQDSELIVLTIAVDEQGQVTATVQSPGQPDGEPTSVDIPNLYDTHTILAVARLDLAGMEAYRENLREPLLPGNPVTFRWSIRANEPGIYRGVVWLRLELVPKAGGAVSEQLLLSRPIEIQAVTILGLSGSMARFLGGIGLIASTFLGYPFIQRWIENWRRGRKNQPSHAEVEKPISASAPSSSASEEDKNPK